MINAFAGPPFLISLISTVASLPFFLVPLPAVGLSVLGSMHLLNPYLMLVSVFFIGVGFAF